MWVVGLARANTMWYKKLLKENAPWWGSPSLNKSASPVESHTKWTSLPCHPSGSATLTVERGEARKQKSKNVGQSLEGNEDRKALYEKHALSREWVERTFDPMGRPFGRKHLAKLRLNERIVWLLEHLSVRHLVRVVRISVRDTPYAKLDALRGRSAVDFGGQVDVQPSGF